MFSRIFDRGLGDLFVVRTAGHVIGPEVLGSIEYGVSVLSARAAGRTTDRDFIAEQIRHTVHLLLEPSRALADAMAAGDVAVVGLAYRLVDGTAELVTLNGPDHVGAPV